MTSSEPEAVARMGARPAASGHLSAEAGASSSSSAEPSGMKPKRSFKSRVKRTPLAPQVVHSQNWAHSASLETLEPSERPALASNHLTADGAEGTESDKQHSVGPVMGIFFKVWSLVKGESAGPTNPRPGSRSNLISSPDRSPLA